MPITVAELFKQTGLSIHGQVKWGQIITSRKCGFYVIALSDDKNKLACSDKPVFNNIEIKQWIKRVELGGKEILIDNKLANVKSIKHRLEKFWLPDETIVYIGKAGPSKRRTIKKRIKELYETKMGCNKKHAGGHWLHILANISSLNIFFSEYSELDIDELEEKLITTFMNKVTNQTKVNLYDSVNCYPFANKELYLKSCKRKIRKAHGLTNQTVDCKMLTSKI